MCPGAVRIHARNIHPYHFPNRGNDEYPPSTGFGGRTFLKPCKEQTSVKTMKEITLRLAFLILWVRAPSPPETNDTAQSHAGKLHRTQDQDPDFKEWLKDSTSDCWSCLLLSVTLGPLTPKGLELWDVAPVGFHCFSRFSDAPSVCTKVWTYLFLSHNPRCKHSLP